jgi:FixJ family two-component response regulator
MSEQPRVSIIGNDGAVGQALSSLLRSDGFDTRAWSCAAEFLASNEPDEPGCVVADLSLPDMTGLELQCALAAREPALPIIFVTDGADLAAAVRGMKAGAVDVLSQPVRRQELVAAVREAVAKNAAVRTVSAHRREACALMDRLTPREKQVLDLVLAGLLNKQIAARLGAAEETIKIHRGRVMKKMQVRSAMALVQFLTTSGLSATMSAGG